MEENFLLSRDALEMKRLVMSSLKFTTASENSRVAR